MTQLDSDLLVSSQGNPRFLVISRRHFDWLDALRASTQKVTVVEKQSDLVEIINQGFNDIVFLDDQVFDIDTIELIQELKNRLSLIAISIITDNTALDYHSALIDAGADDVVLRDVPIAQFMHQLKLLLRHHSKNQSLAWRTQKLHAVSMLAQKLHNTDHPMTLITETIDAVCKNFNIYGVAITIDEGDMTHLYAGIHGIDNRRRLYESTAKMHMYDPLYQVIANGVSLICKDVKNHPYYTPIPVIDRPRSAVIVPLKYGDQVLGSLGLFSEDHDFTNNDLATYELLATHFASAYFNVRHYFTREVDVRSKRQLLRAWQTLATVYEVDEIARTLHDFLVDVDTVRQAVVWLYKTEDDGESIIVYSDVPALSKLVESLYKEGRINEMMSEFDASMQPIALNQRQIRRDSANELFKLMETSQITLLPVAGNMFVGGVFVCASGNHTFTPQEINLMESLAHATAQAMERNTLIGSLQEQTGRLEAVLRSINEAIFFVREDGTVIYCNPQFTEITNINPSLVIRESYTELLHLLTRQVNKPDALFETLKQTVSAFLSSDDKTNYPIVELTRTDGSHLVMEFQRITGENESTGWIGYIRPQRTGHANNVNGQSALLSEFVQDISIPLMELQKLVMILPEQYDLLKPRKYHQLLGRVETNVQGVQSMWNNFLQIYNAETSGLNLRLETVEPVEFIQETVNSRRLSGMREQIRIGSVPPRVTISADERLLRQVISNMIELVGHFSNGEAPIAVQIAPENDHIVISVQDKTTILGEDTIDALINPLSETDIADDLQPFRLSVYMSQQIIRAHEGEFTIESRRGWGLMIKLRLPVLQITGEVPAQPTASISATAKNHQGLTTIVIESKSALLANLYDQLTQAGHELLPEQRLDDALTDLGLTQVDLILFEVDRADTDIADICQAIRARTDVPMVCVAIPDVEEACINAMQNGLDDYFLTPINQEKMLAQLSSIAKRKDIASRTAEPIHVGDLYIDFSRRRVYLKDKLLDLTAKEYELLRVLVMHRNQVLTHQQLLTKIWGPEYREETPYLWVSVSRLRRKLEPQKDSPRYIQTEQGIGYVFQEP